MNQAEIEAKRAELDQAYVACAMAGKSLNAASAACKAFDAEYPKAAKPAEKFVPEMYGVSADYYRNTRDNAEGETE